jgi:hypothetical protein
MPNAMLLQCRMRARASDSKDKETGRSRWTRARAVRTSTRTHWPVGNTVDKVFRLVPSSVDCKPSAACRWGRTSAAPPDRTSGARTGKLACASPAAPASGGAPWQGPCLAAAGAAAWQCCLRLQCCSPCCPLRSCADGAASLGGADGVCICFIGKSDLVVSQNTLRGMHLGFLQLHAAC